MTTRHFYADASTINVDQIEAVLREQLAIATYRMSDNLRTAAMYIPNTTSPALWVEACARVGIDQGSARNRLREVRIFQREMGEI